MNLKPLLFNESKAIEVVLYLLHPLKKSTFHQIFKILYFSDKLHLGKYGRFILKDEYIAMKHGPVPSYLYNLLKSFRSPSENASYKKSIEVKNDYELFPLRCPNLALLSESEKECLDEATQQYGKLSFAKLTELSHDDAWDKADENDRISIEDIAATLPNHAPLLEHLKNPY